VRRLGRQSRQPVKTFHYLSPHLLDGSDHLIVDGAPRFGTVGTLSHWPGTPTPAALRADLSTEIARVARRRSDLLPAGVDTVSIDHFDVDGVLAVALLVVDGLDDEHGPVLVEAARVGDFDVVTDRRAALIAFALNGLQRQVAAEYAEAPRPQHDQVLESDGEAAGRALKVIVDLAADPDRFAPWWRDEWRAYDASREALAAGRITIEEVPDLDLAVVRVDPGVDVTSTRWKSAPLHPAAIHSATSRLRVATVAGDRGELRYRYESWVRLVSRRPRPRVDLDRLAGELTALETDGARWVFDGAGALRAALHLKEPDTGTSIDTERLIELMRRGLRTADQGLPAWDPYR
jgi:uncharacterized protein DUF6687